jgi:hypothetical protein
MYILLTWWQDFGFFLALQAGQLLDSLFDNAQCLIDLFFCNDERWCQSDNVLMRRFCL